MVLMSTPVINDLKDEADVFLSFGKGKLIINENIHRDGSIGIH